MEISVFFAHILDASRQTGTPLPQLLDQLHSAGIRQTELDVCHVLTEEPWLEQLRQAGIQPVCVNEHYALEAGFQEEQVRDHIHAALAAGAKLILVVPGYLSKEEAAAMSASMESYEKTAAFLGSSLAVGNMVRHLRAICAMAREAGLQVVIEDFDHPHSPLCSLNGLRWFLEQVEGLGCNFDTGNFITFGEDVFSAWEQLHSRVLHTHCKDRADSPTAVGSGRLPLEGLLAAIREDGYDGSFAIEHYGAADQLGCMLSSAAFLERVLH